MEEQIQILDKRCADLAAERDALRAALRQAQRDAEMLLGWIQRRQWDKDAATDLLEHTIADIGTTLSLLARAAEYAALSGSVWSGGSEA